MNKRHIYLFLSSFSHLFVFILYAQDFIIFNVNFLFVLKKRFKSFTKIFSFLTISYLSENYEDISDFTLLNLVIKNMINDPDQG